MLLYFSMKACAICCRNAKYICKPCKVAFCTEHVSLHAQSKIKEHIFEEIRQYLDSGQLNKIVENLTLKINKVKELKESIILEAGAVMERVAELSMNSLQAAKEKEQFYVKLLQACQNRY